MPDSQNNNNSISEFHQLVRNFGPTSGRPSANQIIGQTYFDTTLGYQVWWNGTGWQPMSGIVIVLVAPARIADDITARAATFTANYSTWGVNLLGGTPLPTNLKGAFFKITVFGTTAATNISIKMEDPLNLSGATAINGYNATAGGNAFTGVAISGVSAATGEIKYTLNAGSGGTNRVVIDVVAYTF